MTNEVYDYICSIGELMDKLSIENIKCYDANNKILAEPNNELISTLEFKACKSGEQRVRLRDEINLRVAEAVSRGSINTSSEIRTYDFITLSKNKKA